jgi:hypothetical protein
VDCISLGVVVATINTIVSFGDSFTYGSELQDNTDGSRAWAGRIAKTLGCNYKTLAVPGCGNEAISRQVVEYFSTNPVENTLAIINWTWSMRWDFYLLKRKLWISLGPTCVPEKLKNLLTFEESAELLQFYNEHLLDAHEWNQFRNLQTIMATQSFLNINQIKNMQTYMDRSLFVSPNQMAPRLEHYNACKSPLWPDVADEAELEALPAHIRYELDQNYQSMQDPKYIQILQQTVWKQMQDFDGQTFLEWSRDRGYEVSPPPGDHPLEQAHEQAEKFWLSKIQQLIQC